MYGALVWLITATTVAAAPAPDARRAIETLTQCERLDHVCMVAAAELRRLGDDALGPVEAALPRMPVAGQFLALSVVESVKTAAAGRFLASVAQNRRYDARVRTMALEDLAARAHERATPTCLALASDKEALLRTAATRALGRRVTYKQDDRILQALMKNAADSEATVRVAALFGLSFSGDARVGALLEAALGDDVVEVRRAAADGLAAIKRESAVPKLIEALAAPDDLMARAAARALAFQTGEDFGTDQARWSRWQRER